MPGTCHILQESLDFILNSIDSENMSSTLSTVDGVNDSYLDFCHVVSIGSTHAHESEKLVVSWTVPK